MYKTKVIAENQTPENILNELDLLLNKNLRYTNKVAAEKTKVRLISSFSKNGLTHLQNTHCGELFKLPENDPRSYAILRYLKNKLSNRIKCIMPSPLDPDTPDAIVIEQDICISTLHTSDTEINIDNFFNKNINMFKLNDLFDSIKVFISDAASYFDLASKMHFQLEDIYHEAMNFDEMENLRLKTSSRIKNFLKQ